MSTENEKQAAPRKPKLSEESATEQMQKLLDSYDINANDLEIENGPEFVQTVVNRLVRAVRDGHLEILDNGKTRHILVVPKGELTEITYRRLDGIAIKAGDKAKDTFESHCALMGSLSSQGPVVMSGLDAVDLSIMQRLAQLFMAS
jgi:hypothetical protein